MDTPTANTASSISRLVRTNKLCVVTDKAATLSASPATNSDCSSHNRTFLARPLSSRSNRASTDSTTSSFPESSGPDCFQSLILVNSLAEEIPSRGRDKEVIEFLLVTANVRDVEFFGGDLTYPIYNFETQETGSGYNTQVGQSAEVIRLIDNLPLATTNNLVEAEIVGQIFTDKNSSEVNKMISNQLKNISNITNPSAAVLGRDTRIRMSSLRLETILNVH